MEIADDIKSHIQSGDSNLKRLFWRDDIPRTEKQEPRKEESLQIFFFDKINTHPLRDKVIGVRELEVARRKKPDIMIACKSPKGEMLKVYVEMKRQCHKKLLTAVEEQLVNQYLTDPESRYGVYLVGWYGPNRYGPPLKDLREVLGGVPGTAKDLEASLQRLCDRVAAKRSDVDKIRAIVIDLDVEH